MSRRYLILVKSSGRINVSERNVTIDYKFIHSIYGEISVLSLHLLFVIVLIEIDNNTSIITLFHEDQAINSHYILIF